ncbi:Regulator of G-protein signaling rgs-2, partial [Armadillidium vulgare]
NILFWQACEDLKRELNPSLVEEKARLIYEDYISILSPKETRVREISTETWLTRRPTRLTKRRIRYIHSYASGLVPAFPELAAL